METTATVTAVPCADCKTTEEYQTLGRATPNRVDGKRFGITGMLCYHCYGRLYSQSRRKSKSTRPRAFVVRPFKVDPLEHQGLVRLLAKVYRNRGADLDDLIGWGQIGLLKACMTFDPDLGNQFSTYASACIKRTIRRELSDKVPAIRLPAYLQKASSSDREKAAANPNIQAAIEARSRQHFGEHGMDVPLSAVAIAPKDRTLEVNEAREAATAYLGRLPAKEAEALRLYFGIDRPESTYKEIGKGLGVTGETARQKINLSLNRLRAMAVAS